MTYLSEEEGVDIEQLPTGTVITVETLYSIYKLVKIDRSSFDIEGGKYLRFPRRLSLGSPWIGRDKPMELIDRGVIALTTSRVQNVRVATDTSVDDMGWGVREGTLGNMG